MKLTLKYLLDYAFSDTSTIISLCVENHKLHRTQKNYTKNVQKLYSYVKVKQVLFEIRFRIISSLA